MLFKEAPLLCRSDKGSGQWGKAACSGPDAESMALWIIRTARSGRRRRRTEEEGQRETAGPGVGDWERWFHTEKRHSNR